MVFGHRIGRLRDMKDDESRDNCKEEQIEQRRYSILYYV